MSEHITHSPHKPRPGHGKMSSYIIGFALSLVFTFFPYYIVKNQIATGTTLLVIILTFAVIQMLIQIFFFLHLGRGPKPLYNVAFFVSTVGIILVVVAGSVVIINNLHYNKIPSDQVKSLVNGEAIYQVNGELTGACHGQYANHLVTINNSQVSPSHTDAKKCDTLTFVNQDDVARKISFGEHDHHGTYAGESEIPVKAEGNKTITLSETGTFTFHDHLEHETAGDFTVQ